MKISSVRIEKFRSFEDTTIPLNDYACLVGPKCPSGDFMSRMNRLSGGPS